MAGIVFLGSEIESDLDDGTPNAGGFIHFYEPNTVTNKDTYSDSALTTANANPVVLDSAGRANIWLNGDYSIKVTDSAAATIYTDDEINPATATVTGNYNLITNGSMENDTNSDGTPDDFDLLEYTGSTNGRVTDDQVHGAASMKFVSTGNGGGRLTSTNFFEVNTDRDIHVSFMLKSSVVDVRNIAQILWFQADQTASATTSTTIYDEAAANPTSWTIKRGYAAVPADAAFAKFRFFGCDSSDATSGTTWLDDVVIRVQTRTEELLTTVGDMIYGSATSTPARLGVGNDRAFLKAGATIPEYGTIPNYWNNLILSNDTDTAHDINVTAGEAADSTGETHIVLSSEITKQIDATWAAGDDAGGMNDGEAVGNDTWYHYHMLSSADGSTVDFGFDTSITAANLLADTAVIAAGLTLYRRIGSVLTDGSANILAFYMEPDRTVVWDAFAQDIALTDGGTSAVTNTISTPLGIRTKAHVLVGAVTTTSASTNYLIVESLDKTAQVPDATLAMLMIRNSTASFSLRDYTATDVWTNASSQIRSRQTVADVNTTLYITVVSFYDPLED